MSQVAVIPNPSSIACAFSSAASRSLASGCGTTLPTRSCAASTKTPEGTPPAFSIRPPAGATLRAVMPAAFSAALLPQLAWPSARDSQTGRSPTAASSSAAVGKRPSPQFSWFQPPPRIHLRSGSPPHSRDLRLRLGQRLRPRQIEFQRAEAEFHHMAMRIDEPGQHHPPLHVRAPVEFVRPLFLRRQQPRDMPVQRHQQAGETDDAPVLVQRDAIDIVDQRIRQRGQRRDRQQRRQRQHDRSETGKDRCRHGPGA